MMAVALSASAAACCLDCLLKIAAWLQYPTEFSGLVTGVPGMLRLFGLRMSFRALFGAEGDESEEDEDEDEDDESVAGAGTL